jgi:hypothetical protein
MTPFFIATTAGLRSGEGVENCKCVVGACAAALWMISCQTIVRRNQLIKMDVIPKLLIILRDYVQQQLLHKLSRDVAPPTGKKGKEKGKDLPVLDTTASSSPSAPTCYCFRDPPAKGSKLDLAFPDNKHILYAIGALAILSQETAGRVALFHNQGLGVLLDCCLQPGVAAYLEPKQLASSAVLNLVATHGLARKECMNAEHINKLCAMLKDPNTYVVEMAVRTLFVFVQKETSLWETSFFGAAVAVINTLGISVQGAHARLMDKDLKQKEEEGFVEMAVRIVEYGVTALWIFAYRLLEFVSKDTGRRGAHLDSLEADDLMGHFKVLALRKWRHSFVPRCASGIVCLMASCRSIRHPDPSQYQYSDVIGTLADIEKRAPHSNVAVNAFCGISQILSYTFQKPDEEKAFAAVLDAGYWSRTSLLFRNPKSMIHKSRDSLVAAAMILTYLSQAVSPADVTVEDIGVIERMLMPDLSFLHTYATACVWGLAQNEEKREMLVNADNILGGVFDIMQNSETAHTPGTPIEPREWAAGAIFALMHDEQFVTKVKTAGVVNRLVGALVEGAQRVKSCVPTDGRSMTARLNNDAGDSERTLWQNRQTKSQTSSTLLFCAVGALWILATSDDGAEQCLDYLPVACTAAALAQYTSETSGDHPIRCPKLRRFCVGLTFALYQRDAHREAITTKFREDIMEFLLVSLLEVKDLSSRCDAAIGISILAMDSYFKITTARLGCIRKLIRNLQDVEWCTDGSDLQYCTLHALLNLSQNRKNQVDICKSGLKMLARIVDTTRDQEVFCLAKAIISNIERNGANKQKFHKFSLSKMTLSVAEIEERWGPDSTWRPPRMLAGNQDEFDMDLYTSSMSLAVQRVAFVTAEEQQTANGFTLRNSNGARNSIARKGLQIRPEKKAQSTTVGPLRTVSPIKSPRELGLTNDTIGFEGAPFDATLGSTRSSLFNTSRSSVFSVGQSKPADVNLANKTLRTSMSSKILSQASSIGLPPPQSCIDGEVSVVRVPSLSNINVDVMCPGSPDPTSLQVFTSKEESLATLPDAGSRGSPLGKARSSPRLLTSPIAKASSPASLPRVDSPQQQTGQRSAQAHTEAEEVAPAQKQLPRLRSGPAAIEKWALPNTWAPRVSIMKRESDNGKTLTVTLEASRVTKKNLLFKAIPKKTKDERSTIRLAKFDHYEGSKVYSDLFNTYQGVDGIGECHFYQTSEVPYEAVLIPYPSPSLEIHGLGQRGYSWPANGLGFPGICQNSYPRNGMDGVVNPCDRSKHFPKLSCPQAAKCPLPPYHSVARSKRLFGMHGVHDGARLDEAESPFFGIFPDDDMTLYIENVYKPPPPPPPPLVEAAPVVIEDDVWRPFRGEAWQLKASFWHDRVKHSDSRDYWDNTKTFTKSFKKDWDRCMKNDRMVKLIKVVY